MKAKRNLLIGIILGVIIGWALGFLRLPYIEKNSSFLLGFISCLAIVLLIISFMFSRKKDPATGRNTMRMLIIFFLALAGLVVSFFLYRQNAVLQKEIADQDKKIKDLSELVSSSGSGDIVALMNYILDEALTDVKNNNGVLSDNIIDKITALSYSFEPARYYEGDSLSEKTISPGRGQLLIALLIMDIDSLSFNKIKSAVSFSGANLNGADLHEADLSNMDLKGAHFKEANLNGADLSGTDLSDANLYAANLNNANLNSADLKRSDLRWAQLNKAHLQMADMNGSQMMDAQLTEAEMYKTKMQWVDMSGALLNKANLRYADLMGTDLTKANLNAANMGCSDLRMISLDEAILDKTEWEGAIVDSLWMHKLPEWHLTVMEKMQKEYKVLNDTADQWKNPLFRLRKMEFTSEKN